MCWSVPLLVSEGADYLAEGRRGVAVLSCWVCLGCGKGFAGACSGVSAGWKHAGALGVLGSALGLVSGAGVWLEAQS